jgi:glycosyltransferase involved in cell wall biosynthesis
MPLVSAIIPTRNRPHLVLAAIHSVLTQTMPDLEVVVVVDGPDHETVEALKQIGDERVRVIPLPESVGGCEARNTGAREARSPWIALLDDDDEWHPQKLALQLAAIKAGVPGEVLSTTRFLLRSESGPKSVWPLRFPEMGEDLSEYLFCTSRNLFQTSTLMCARETILKTPFTVGLRRLQDWDWMLHVMARPEVRLVCVDEVLTTYNVHAGTVSKASDWENSLAWARENRHLMSKRAYSCFLSKKCAADARRQNAGSGAYLRLLGESFRYGEPSARSFAMFCAYTLLSSEKRHKLGDFLYRPSLPADID